MSLDLIVKVWRIMEQCSGRYPPLAPRASRRTGTPPPVLRRAGKPGRRPPAWGAATRARPIRSGRGGPSLPPWSTRPTSPERPPLPRQPYVTAVTVARAGRGYRDPAAGGSLSSGNGHAPRRLLRYDSGPGSPTSPACSASWPPPSAPPGAAWSGSRSWRPTAPPSPATWSSSAGPRGTPPTWRPRPGPVAGHRDPRGRGPHLRHPRRRAS